MVISCWSYNFRCQFTNFAISSLSLSHHLHIFTYCLLYPLSHTSRFSAHVKDMLTIPGAKLLFGGDLLTGHNIPEVYGSFRPTAIQVGFIFKCFCGPFVGFFVFCVH